MSQLTKKNILCGVSLFIAIMTLVALAFPVIVIEAKIYGTSLGKLSESGFDFLSFESRIFDYDWAITLVGVLCLVQLIISIVLIGLNAISIFYFDEDKAFKFSMLTIIICFILNLMYLIEGCVAVSTFHNSNYYTLTYVAFILNILFTFAYIGFIYYTKKVDLENRNNFKYMQKQNNIAKITNNTNSYIENSSGVNIDKESSNIDMLKKYKQLLDEGIITQEEFDKKKDKLL